MRSCCRRTWVSWRTAWKTHTAVSNRFNSISIVLHKKEVLSEVFEKYIHIMLLQMASGSGGADWVALSSQGQGLYCQSLRSFHEWMAEECQTTSLWNMNAMFEEGNSSSAGTQMISPSAERGQSFEQLRILIQFGQLVLRANPFQHLLYSNMKSAEVNLEKIGGYR